MYNCEKVKKHEKNVALKSEVQTRHGAHGNKRASSNEMSSASNKSCLHSIPQRASFHVILDIHEGTSPRYVVR